MSGGCRRVALTNCPFRLFGLQTRGLVPFVTVTERFRGRGEPVQAARAARVLPAPAGAVAQLGVQLAGTRAEQAPRSTRRGGSPCAGWGRWFELRDRLAGGLASGVFAESPFSEWPLPTCKERGRRTVSHSTIDGAGGRNEGDALAAGESSGLSICCPRVLVLEWGSMYRRTALRWATHSARAHDQRLGRSTWRADASPFCSSRAGYGRPCTVELKPCGLGVLVSRPCIAASSVRDEAQSGWLW